MKKLIDEIWSDIEKFGWKAVKSQKRHYVDQLNDIIPNSFEKNNLPYEVKKQFCETIEKYQAIMKYEYGIIDKEELSKILAK